MKKNTQKAFVLFYTIIIVGAILSSTSIMLSIYIKNLKLGGVARESVIAYSAAETGAECALYWYLNGAIFESGNVQALLSDGITETPARCMGQQIDVTEVGAINRFKIWYVNGDDSGPCALVDVTYASPGIFINSRGFNVCGTSHARVERGYQIEY